MNVQNWGNITLFQCKDNMVPTIVPTEIKLCANRLSIIKIHFSAVIRCV